MDEYLNIITNLDNFQVEINALQELQVKSGEELSALMPSILDKAFKGEL
jgi:type I restriction enzyme, S subunit